MIGNSPTAWRPLCCYEDRGPCNCGGAIAYVMSGVYGDWETGLLSESTWMRLCPAMFEGDNEEAWGLVIYHELIHMVSYAGDAEGGYTKLGAHRIAQINPEIARLSADNYTLYTAQHGMSYDDYTNFTRDWWGKNTYSTTCTDAYGPSYCWEQAENCCDYSATPSLADDCCATCTRMAVSPQCANNPNASAPIGGGNENSDARNGGDNAPTTGGANDCQDLYTNCADPYVTGEGCCGVK